MVKFGHPYHLAFFTIVVFGQEATLLWKKNSYVVMDRRQVFIFEDFDFGRRTTSFKRRCLAMLQQNSEHEQFMTLSLIKYLSLASSVLNPAHYAFLWILTYIFIYLFFYFLFSLFLFYFLFIVNFYIFI